MSAHMCSLLILEEPHLRRYLLPNVIFRVELFIERDVDLVCIGYFQGSVFVTMRLGDFLKGMFFPIYIRAIC